MNSSSGFIWPPNFGHPFVDNVVKALAVDNVRQQRVKDGGEMFGRITLNNPKG